MGFYLCQGCDSLLFKRKHVFTEAETDFFVPLLRPKKKGFKSLEIMVPSSRENIELNTTIDFSQEKFELLQSSQKQVVRRKSFENVETCVKTNLSFCKYVAVKCRKCQLEVGQYLLTMTKQQHLLAC